MGILLISFFVPRALYVRNIPEKSGPLAVEALNRGRRID
jgi:hypothetical protein